MIVESDEFSEFSEIREKNYFVNKPKRYDSNSPLSGVEYQVFKVGGKRGEQKVQKNDSNRRFSNLETDKFQLP